MIRTLLILLIASPAFAQNTIDIPIELVCDAETIVAYKLVPEKTRYIQNESTSKWEEWTHPEHVAYMYVSDTEAPATIGEDITKRLPNAQFFKKPSPSKNKEAWSATFYPGNPFHYDEKEEKWYSTEWNYITPEEFEKQTSASWYKKLRKMAYITKMAYASADTLYSGSGDGYQFYTNVFADWDDTHDAANSTYIDDTGDSTMVGVSEFVPLVGFVCQRSHFPVDTSALPDDCTIDSATFEFRVTSKTGKPYVQFCESTMDDPTNIVAGDYNEVRNPNLATSTIRIIGNIKGIFTLNATGISKISKLGWTKFGIKEYDYDVLDVEPGGIYNCTINTSEKACAATEKPQLKVNYTVTTARRIFIVH